MGHPGDSYTAHTMRTQNNVKAFFIRIYVVQRILNVKDENFKRGIKKRLEYIQTSVEYRGTHFPRASFGTSQAQSIQNIATNSSTHMNTRRNYGGYAEKGIPTS